MNRKIIYTVFITALYLPAGAHSEDRLDLDTTTIKGNKELPKILYVVPWKDTEKYKQRDRKLVLHSLFGHLFEPVLPEQKRSEQP